MIRFLVLALLLATSARAASLDVLYPNTATFTVAGTSSDLTSVAYSFDAFATAGVACTGTYSWRCTITNATGARTLSIRATGAAGTTTKTITLYGPTWLLDVDNRGSGVERVSSPTLDATGATVVLACNMKDVVTTTLTCDTGGAMPEAGSGTSPTSGLRAPVTGADNGSTRYYGAKRHQSASTSLGDVGANDAVFIAVVNNPSLMAGEHIVDKMNASNIGWTMYFTNTGLSLYAKGSGGNLGHEVAVTPGAWVVAVCFLDRASSTGIQCFANGAAGSAVTATTIGDTTTTTPPSIGSDGFGGSLLSADVAYVEVRTCATCINQADFATIAKEWTASYAGILPSVAAGTDEPSTMTRATVAQLDIDNGTSTQLFTVGAGWPRVVARKTPQEAVVREGFLSEPQSTNLILQAQTFDNASWGKNNGTDTVTANALAGPDYATTADALVADATSVNHGLNQSATLTAASYTLSVYAKAGNQPSLLLYETIGLKGVCFNLSTKAIVGNYNGTSGQTSEIKCGYGPNADYCRASMTWTATAVSTSLRIITSGDADSCGVSDHVFTGDAVTVNTYLWNAQVEAQPVATSPILTTTAASTRNGDDFRYSSTTNSPTLGGMIDVEYRLPSFDVPTAPISFLVSVDNGTTADRTNLVVIGASDVFEMGSLVGGVAQSGLTSTGGDRANGMWHRARFNGTLNDGTAYDDGVLVGADAAMTIPTATTIRLGADFQPLRQTNGAITKTVLRSQSCNLAVCP